MIPWKVPSSLFCGLWKARVQYFLVPGLVELTLVTIINKSVRLSCYSVVMHKVILRRTLNIGNFESISAEAVGEHEDFEKARVIASKYVLETLKQELIRIFNIRIQNTHSNPWDQVNMELDGVNTELIKH